MARAMGQSTNAPEDSTAMRSNGRPSTTRLRDHLSKAFAEEGLAPPANDGATGTSTQGGGEPRSSGTLTGPTQRKPTPTSRNSISLIPTPSPDSKISRPRHVPLAGSQQRRTISLADSYRMADDEEDAAQRQGSPSPAPRPRLAKREADERRLQGIRQHRRSAATAMRTAALSPGLTAAAAKGLDDDVASEAGSESAASVRSSSDGSLERKLSRFERDRLRMEKAQASHTGSVFKSASVGPKITETGHALVQKASHGSLSGQESQGRSPNPEMMTDPAWKETGAPEEVPRASGAGNAGIEDDVSFAWQADTDFTASDLQVSMSPRVRTTNTKLDDIIARELEVEAAMPLEGIEPATSHSPAVSPVVPGKPQTKLDAVRAREIESLSRRAIASHRLDEIRERNAGSVSPGPQDLSRRTSRESLRQWQSAKPTPAPDRIAFEGDGEQIPNTPVTIYKRQAPNPTTRRVASLGNEPLTGLSDDAVVGGVVSHGEASAAVAPSVKTRQRDASKDLLRRLARMSTSSPPTSSNQSPLATSQDPDKEDGQQCQAPARSASLSTQQPDVGGTFKLDQSKAVRRVQSSESTRAKRSSMATSENDPTDRIEGEMQLFAPYDNQSERGSIRAPSPPIGSDDDDEDDGALDQETPRPPKHDKLRILGAGARTDLFAAVHQSRRPARRLSDDGSGRRPSRLSLAIDQDDVLKTSKSTPDLASQALGELGVDSTPLPQRPDPLTLPTPKVTGAFVDTPAPPRERSSSATSSLAAPDPPPSSDKAAEGPSLSKSSSASSVAAQPARTALKNRRRARSLPRASRSITNSAKIPSVRDDLIELRGLHQIEDSTLDDFSALLATGGSATAGRPVPSRDSDAAELASPDAATYDRMGKSLETGLLGILSVKRGIQRLQDRVETVAVDGAIEDDPENTTKQETQQRDIPPSKQHPGPIDAVQDCAMCRSGVHTRPVVSYLHLPVPSLFRRSPKFHLSPLGVAVVVLSAWYIVESIFCALFCPPTIQSCYFNAMIGRPCRLSSVRPPRFGTAIPVKLDEWLTNGRGRDSLADAVEWTAETAADAWDSLLGKEIGPDDVAATKDSEARKALRRRLRRKGLLGGGEVATEGGMHAQLNAWKAERLARERVLGARYRDWNDEEAESMGQDEAL